MERSSTLEPRTGSREARLNAAFVALADTLTSDFDLNEVLQTLVDTCADVLDTTAAGLMLVDREGRLQLLASTAQEARAVEVAQISAQSGPCFESFTTGRPVTVPDIADAASRWPVFAEAALRHGYRSMHAVPLRLRQNVLGSMNLFDTAPRALGDADIAVAQALADVATIGILQERLIRETSTVADQLQRALSSRVVIEQAKGALAAVCGTSVDDAFNRMRVHARRTNTSLRDVAAAVVDRSSHLLRPQG